ncbi:MAG: putative fumarylacetoacetate hydrolase [Acidimicrobiaceae bacterium]|nr:putative fumarylacetoacetate hydrolase [Acidimicrobiaceae bacterium]
MRLATIITERGPRLHVRGRSGYVDAADASGNGRYSSLNAVLQDGMGAMDSLRGLANQDGTTYGEAELGPACPEPPRVLCLGVNYLAHALEFAGRGAPTWPESFVRGTDSVLGPYADLVKPALVERFDFEGELGIVIGSGGRYIPAAKALDAVAGYVIINDGSAREWQRAATQWTPGKNFDATMPIGPEVVTPDELDVSDVQLTTRLNGEVMQQASTAQMIVSVPRAIEYLSSFTTLRPGDVIATGTPGGVGAGRTPPVWMQPGDVIEVEIEGIGTIRNRVVAEKGDVADWPWRVPAQAS